MVYSSLRLTLSVALSSAWDAGEMQGRCRGDIGLSVAVSSACSRCAVASAWQGIVASAAWRGRGGSSVQFTEEQPHQAAKGSNTACQFWAKSQKKINGKMEEEATWKPASSNHSRKQQLLPNWGGAPGLLVPRELRGAEKSRDSEHIKLA